MAVERQTQPRPAGLPTSLVGPPPGAGVEQAEAYLAEKGWEMRGRNASGQALWEDPATRGLSAISTHEYTLPAKGGGVDTFRQVVVPPVRWPRTTEDALRLQRNRDAKPGTPSTDERIDSLALAYRELDATVTRLIGAVGDAVSRVTPESPDKARAELQILKARLAEAVAQARQAQVTKV
jgi:hypothetical protein